MGEEGGEEVGPVLFGDWKFIRNGSVIELGEVGAEVKFDFVGAGPEKGTGRGGKGNNGRTGAVCGCLVRLGGPQPVPLPVVRPGASDE